MPSRVPQATPVTVKAQAVTQDLPVTQSNSKQGLPIAQSHTKVPQGARIDGNPVPYQRGSGALRPPSPPYSLEPPSQQKAVT